MKDQSDPSKKQNIHNNDVCHEYNVSIEAVISCGSMWLIHRSTYYYSIHKPEHRIHKPEHIIELLT